MKTNIKTLLFAAALMLSSSMWADNTMPAGTYYFDFSACTGENAAKRVEIFNGIENNTHYVNLVSTSTCAANDGVTQNASPTKQFYNGGNDFTVFCVTLDEERSTSDASFIQYQMADNGWKSWADYTTPTPVSGETNIFLCKVSYSGKNCIYEWFTGSLPVNICSITPILTFTAGANGTITTATAGGETVTSGDEDGVAAGTIVNLVATPNTGYAFYGWQNASGDIVSSDADYTFSMPSAGISLTAIFYVESTDPSIIGCDGCFRVAP